MLHKSSLILLFFTLLLMACSTEEAAPQVAGSQRSNSTEQNNEEVSATEVEANNTSTATTLTLANLPAPTPDNFVLPSLDIQGAIAFIHESALYLAHFDGNEATLLSESSVPTTIYAKENGEVVYTALGSQSPTGVFNRYPSVFVYSSKSGELIGEFPLQDDTGIGQVEGWSPDGQWLTISRFQPRSLLTQIVAVDGSFASELWENTPVTMWLNDNTVLLFEIGQTSDDSYSIQRYDPATDSFLDIDIDVNLASNSAGSIEDIFRLSDQLAEQNLQIGSLPQNLVGNVQIDFATLNYVTIVEPEELNEATVCDSWSIESGGPDVAPTTLYTVSDTHALSDLHVLSDGSLIFMRWFKADCRFAEALQAEVVHVLEDGTANVVARDLFVDVQSVATRGFFRPIPRRMDVSADGRYLVWISQEDLTRGDIALNLHDLETGESAMLLKTLESDGVFFLSLAWVD